MHIEIKLRSVRTTVKWVKFEVNAAWFILFLTDYADVMNYNEQANLNFRNNPFDSAILA
jgi:hypothetical protein